MSGFLSSLGRSGGNKSRGASGSSSSGTPTPSTPLAADLFSIPPHAATPAHLDMEVEDGRGDDDRLDHDDGHGAPGTSGHSDPSTLDSHSVTHRGRPMPGTRAKRAVPAGVPPPTPPDSASLIPPMGLRTLPQVHAQQQQQQQQQLSYDPAAALYAPMAHVPQGMQPSVPSNMPASSYATQLTHATSTSSKASGQTTPKARPGSLIAGASQGTIVVPPVPPLPPQHEPTIRAAPQPSGHTPTLTQQPLPPPPSYEAHRFPQGPPPMSPGAGGQGRSPGRFPRWRGWLEKRALERHYERMDALARGLPDTAVSRKKSWGPAVNDANAVSFHAGEGGEEEDRNRPPTPPPLPGPLHVHEFGSRFLPHLTSQPLCAVFLDIPHPPPAIPTGMSPPRLGTRLHKEGKRVVLLVGTEEGLYAVETRKEASSGRDDSFAAGSSSRSNANQSNRRWNGQIRCVEVWSGLGVYQLAVLCSSSQDASARSPTSSLPFFSAPPRRPDATASNGILLGLCAPSRRAKSSARTTFSQLSSQLGSQASGFFESGNDFAATNNGHGDLNDGGPPFSAPQWGAGAGGGPGRATPPSGTGRVRMWNLDSLRGVVAYALDSPNSLPLDLGEAKRSKSSKPSKFSSKLRKAWASLGDPSSERDPRRNRRSASELQAGADGSKKQAPLNEWGAPPRRSMESITSSEGSVGEDGLSTDLPLSPASRAARGLPPLSPEDAAYQRALKAVANYVPISLPGQAPQRNEASGSGALFGSFGGAGDDEDGASLRSSKGKDRESASQSGSGSGVGSATNSSSGGGGGSNSKSGVLFFSVYEAGEGHKAKGTWYLGLATAHKSLLIYEAMPPKRGATRAWTFLRELWCPFHPKAFTFTYCQIQAHDREGLTRSATVVRQSRYRDASGGGGGGGSTTSGHSRQASAVAYSSVLRPQYQGGDAGPIGWSGADLSVALCLGSRLVVIRVSDSNVRELELRPSPSRDAPFLGRPGSRRGSEGLDQQLSSVAEVPLTQFSSKGSSRRSIEALGTVSSTGSSGGAGARKEPKEVWAGFTHVEARILVLQETEDDGTASAAAAALGASAPSRPCLPRSASDFPFRPSAASPTSAHGDEVTPKPGPIPAVSRWREEATAPLNRKASAPLRDKDLPPAPAPQSLDFAPRQTQSATGHLDARFLEDDSDDDSDDSGGASSGFGLPNRLYAVSLRDPGTAGSSSSSAAGQSPSGAAAAAAATGAAASSDPELLSRQRERRKAAKLADAARDASKLVSVSLCIVTKGSSSQILPSPLPVDLNKPAPLAYLQWAETPQAVHAWSRIVGLERNRSAGSVSTTSLSSLSGLNNGGSTTPGGSGNGLGGSSSGFRSAGANSPTPSSNSASRDVVLHVSVTALAFLGSRRIEMRRILVKCPHALPFAVERHSALTLHPAPSPMGGSGGGGGGGGASSNEEEEEEAIVDPFLRPSLEEATRSEEVELEYLGGSLVVVPQAGGSSANASSAGRVKRPWESAGDGGAWAFQWRNGGDFRLFFVGAEV